MSVRQNDSRTLPGEETRLDEGGGDADEEDSSSDNNQKTVVDAPTPEAGTSPSSGGGCSDGRMGAYSTQS